MNVALVPNDKLLYDYVVSAGFSSESCKLFIVQNTFADSDIIGTYGLFIIAALAALVFALLIIIYFFIHKFKIDNKIIQAEQVDKITGAYQADVFFVKAHEMMKRLPQSRLYFSIIRLDMQDLILESFSKEKCNQIFTSMKAFIASSFCGEDNIISKSGHGDYTFLTCCRADEINSSKYLMSFEVPGIQVPFKVVSGVYIRSPGNGVTIEMVMNYIEIALAKAIKNGIPMYYFNAKDEDNYKLEVFMITEMEEALKKGQFIFYLQPIYSMIDHKFVGAEALARWDNPDRGMIPPGVFIPIFEKNGSITDLDFYIYDKTCAFIHDQIVSGREVVPISVNISRIDLFNVQLISYLDSLIKKYNISKELLNLEITESALGKDYALMVKVVNRLSEAGYQVFVDDFGSGYSSFNSIQDFKLSAVKVDVKFLDNCKDYKGQMLMKFIIQMVHALGIKTIIEGVETKEEADFLTSVGGDEVQGYYFARPMPVSEYIRLMDDKILRNHD